MQFELLRKKIIDSKKSYFTKEDILQMIEESKDTIGEDAIESGGYIIDPVTRKVSFNDVYYHLPKKEFMVVYYLMLNKNKVINRDKLINDIWGTDVIVIDRTIDVHIRKIRKRLSDNNIKTFKGIGYGWIEK
jgi:two-component system alkaline phosphatase synthesis response regulator PhoP